MAAPETTDATRRLTFTKEERLSRKKLIDELFKNGSSFNLQPFKIIYLDKKGLNELTEPEETLFPVQVLISVSKRNFKRAVDRNRIKRLIREAYRANKHLLYDSLRKKETPLLLGILYTSRVIESFSFIQQKLISALKRLAEENFNSEKHPA